MYGKCYLRIIDRLNQTCLQAWKEDLYDWNEDNLITAYLLSEPANTPLIKQNGASPLISQNGASQLKNQNGASQLINKNGGSQFSSQFMPSHHLAGYRSFQVNISNIKCTILMSK